MTIYRGAGLLARLDIVASFDPNDRHHRPLVVDQVSAISRLIMLAGCAQPADPMCLASGTSWSSFVETVWFYTTTLLLATRDDWGEYANPGAEFAVDRSLKQDCLARVGTL